LVGIAVVLQQAESLLLAIRFITEASQTWKAGRSHSVNFRIDLSFDRLGCWYLLKAIGVERELRRQMSMIAIVRAGDGTYSSRSK